MSSALSFNLQVTYNMYFLFYYMVNFIGFLSHVSTHVAEETSTLFPSIQWWREKKCCFPKKRSEEPQWIQFCCLFIAEQIANVIFVDFKLICFRYAESTYVMIETFIYRINYGEEKSSDIEKVFLSLDSFLEFFILRYWEFIFI